MEHRARRFGHSKYGWARLSNGLFDLVTLLFLHRYTRRPLHLFGFMGLLFSVAGFVVMLGFAVNWALTGELHIRPLMVAGASSMILGVQFISIGLLGEMINQRFTPASPPSIAVQTPDFPAGSET